MAHDTDTYPKCKGSGTVLVYNGSIHDPTDPEYINCKFCSGRGWVVWVDNPH